MTADAKLDGKYLLRTSDPHLSAEDITLGYKQLLEVERGWLDMKQVLDLRAVFPQNRLGWLEDRIRAHVLLCWLAVIIETRARHHHRGFSSLFVGAGSRSGARLVADAVDVHASEPGLPDGDHGEPVGRAPRAVGVGVLLGRIRCRTLDCGAWHLRGRGGCT